MDPLLLWWFAVGGGGDDSGTPSELTRISSTHTTSTSSSYAIPGTYESGDLIVIIQSRPNTTLPTTPSGYTSFLTVSTTNASARASRKTAASSSETVNLDLEFGVNKTIFVFSGADPVSPIGDTDTASGNDRTATIDGLTLAASTSFVLAIVQTASLSSDGNSAETPSLPSGLTSVGSASGYRGMYVGPTGTFTSKSSTVESSAPPGPGDPDPQIRFVTMSIEIVAAT